MQHVICCGDSNTWGYDPRSFFGSRYPGPWPELLAGRTGWQVVNEGENGRQIPVIPMECPDHTDLLILMLGTNDLLQGLTPEETARKMEAFLTRLELPRDRLVLIAPPPMKPGEWVTGPELVAASRTLAQEYRALCVRLGIPFVDAGQWKIPLSFDGVHFTEEGHRVFAQELWHYLVRKGAKVCVIDIADKPI